MTSVSYLTPRVEPDEESIFGPIITGGDVEDWAVAELQRWSCTYLSEVERQHGIPPGTLPDVRSWVPATSFDKWPEDQIPGVLLVCGGTSERPLREGSGRYRARWAVRLGVICSARTQAESHRLAMLYLGAHASILIQRPSLGGHASGVDWIGEDYTALDYDDVRSLYAGEALFTVEVSDVRRNNAGPLDSDVPLDSCTDPWPPWWIAKTVDVDVESVGITEDWPAPGPSDG